MIAKDKNRLAALRAIKSELLVLATGKSKAGKEDEVKALQKMVKQRKESASIYEQQGRDELVEEELKQVEVISEFLPKQMSEEEVKAVLQEIIQKTGASGPSDMGKVMGMATKELAGKAEGKTIATLTKSLLNQ